MKRVNVKVREDLLVELYRRGKKENIPVATLVDQLLREGLRKRRLADEFHLCPF